MMIRQIGASVIILEKKMLLGGGNGLLSGGAIAMPRTEEHRSEFADYMEQVYFGTTGRDVIDAYIIFDEEVKTAGPLSFAMGGYSAIIEGYHWSLKIKSKGCECLLGRHS